MHRELLVYATEQPGDRPPAPGPLRLVQDFVNTIDREHGPDLFDDDGGLREWLDRRDLAPGVPVAADEVASARHLREALRALLLVNNGEPEAPWASAVLQEAGRRGRLEPAFGSGSPRLVPRAEGVDAALAWVVAAAFDAMLDGTWSRLKACPRDVCQWAFYDRSTNASSTWCSMRVCGGRVKAGAYYRRRRAAAHS